MRGFLESSLFFPVFMGIAFYLLADVLRKKLKSVILNPLLISVMLTVLVLVLCGIDYGEYKSGAVYLSYLLTPATVSLAIPLYRRLYVLRGNTAAILAGIFSGTVASLSCIFSLALLFGLSHAEYVPIIPKSVTTAIGIGITEALGGDASVTAAAILVTGIFGNVSAPLILKLFGIKDPIAKGVAIGTASHAIGTTRAMEMGETEGAVSGLSLVVSGIITVIGASIFAGLI